MKFKLTRYVVCMVFIVIVFAPILNHYSIQSPLGSQEDNEKDPQSNPIADYVSPQSPGIEYSGDPGGNYLPSAEGATVGPQKLIVLLVYFSDLSNTESVSTFNSLIFGNVSDYYQEISYGQCSLSGTVGGWYDLGNTKASYGADGATSGVTDDVDDDGDNDSWKLVDDALAAADPVIDFSSYEHIMVVHAGNGQESSGVSDDIWSVRWSWPGHFITDEKTFDSCSIVPEHQGGDVDRCIGVIAHEFGHDIGLPDLYHYGKSGSDDLVGIWGLMASGSWGGSPSGTKPVHMTAYSKLMLGWYHDSEIYDLTAGTYDFTLTSSYNQTSGLRVVRYNITSTYYYLVEARYQAGYDGSLYQSGVIVTRVDTTKGSGRGIVQVRSDFVYNLDYGSWTPSYEFTDPVSDFAVEILSQEDTSFKIRVTADPLKGWLKEDSISDSLSDDYRNPVMATNSIGTLYCAYMVWDSDLGHYYIRMKHSDDGGYSWSNSFGFYHQTMSYVNPSIAIDVYDDTIYIAFERTDGATHNVGLARYFANHSLMGFSTIATDARDPSIFAEYSYQSNNWFMLAYEKWSGDSSSSINVDLSEDHGDSWSTKSTHSIDTFNLDPEIVCSRGYDGITRWHLIYIAGNNVNNLTRVVASRSSNYFSDHSGWTTDFTCTISTPSIAAIRGAPMVFYAWTVNRFESDSIYQHDIYMWYSSNNGETLSSQTALYYTTSDEMYPKLVVDGQDLVRYSKGVAYLTYFKNDQVCIRRIYYDRLSNLGEEEVLSSTGYAYPNGIALTTHYSRKQYYPVVSWLNNTPNHEIVVRVPGYYKTFGSSSPGYPIAFNGHTYECPVTLGLMFGYTYSVELNSYHMIDSRERYHALYWESIPHEIQSYSLNVTFTVDRFDNGYDLISAMQYKWTLEFVGDIAYENSGWLDSGTNTSFWASEGSSNSTTRFVFSHWSGNVTGMNNMESSWVIMTGPVWAYAHWTTQYYVEVISEHSTTSSTGWYNKSLTINVAITDEFVNETEQSRWRFENWYGNATGTNYSASNDIVIDGPKKVYVNWVRQYLVTGYTIGREWPTRYWWFDAGSSSTFNWETNVSYVTENQERLVFDHWGGNITGTDYSSSSLLVIDAPKTIYAYWRTEFYLNFIGERWDCILVGERWYNESENAHFSLEDKFVNTSVTSRLMFLSWAGDATGDDYRQSDNILMDQYREGRIDDIAQFLISVESTHDDVAGTHWVNKSASFSVTVDRIIEINSGKSRWYCRGFTIDDENMNTSNTANIDNIDDAHQIIFHWVKQYYLEITSIPSDLSGTEDLVAQSGWFDENAVVTIVAVQIPNHILHEWLLDGLHHEGTNTSTVVFLDTHHILTGVYIETETTDGGPLGSMTSIILIAGAIAGVGAAIVAIVAIKRKQAGA